MFRFKILMIFLPVLSGHLLIAQHSIVEDDTSKVTKGQIIPLPAIYYTPETRLAVGTLGIYLFRTGKNVRTSNVDFLVLYTLNKQLIVDPLYTIFTRGEKYFIKGNILYTKFPEYFYGIGNDSPPDTREDIAYKTFRIYNRVLRQVKPKFFVGLQHQYFNTFDVRFREDSHFPPGSIPGEKGSITSGAGPSVVYDTRDNILNASKGVYAEFSTIFYNSFFGSQYRFHNFLLDVRKFKTIAPGSILALQGVVNFNYGDVPFKQLAVIGGTYSMRGYYSGRYRDKHLFVAQAELRQHIYKRFGVALFTGVGDVMHALHRFNPSRIKITGGAGLRFKLSRKENLNIRLDAGFGKNTHGFYLNISEAF